MCIKDRINALRLAIKHSHTHSDWRQRIAHPEELEAETWGSSDIIAQNIVTGKWKHTARVYDSGDMNLVLVMRQHVEALLDFAERFV